MPTLSIVILTKNRPSSLVRCLTSLAKSAQKPELVVVYNNSNKQHIPEYSRVINQFSKQLPLVHSVAASEGIATMRNKAVALTQQDIVTSLDDDCELAPTAIARIKKSFENNTQVGVLGARIVNIGFSGKDQYKGRGRLGINGKYETCIDQSRATFFGSATMSIHRKAFEAVGGYDEFFDVAMEEADLITSIKNKGYSVVYAPDIEVKHYNDRKSFSYSANFIKKEHCRLYFFFKHYMPDSVERWTHFFLNELILIQQLLFPNNRKTQTHNQLSLRHTANSLYAFSSKLLLSLTARVTFPFALIFK